MDAAALWLWLCLLLATASARVIRDTMATQEDPEEQQEPCQTYTLSNLLHLDCSDRGLTKLPNDLNFDAQVLLLSHNKFSSFPRELQQFLQVQILDLSGNSLTDPLPAYMETWNSLHTVNLSNNNYDSWPKNEHTYDIKRLDLSKNKINNIDEDAFTRMPHLHFLDLSENRIYDLPPGVFTHANNLVTLILSRNFFSEVPSFRSPSLRSLYLSYCQITHIDVNALTAMNSLVEIDLHSNQIDSLPDGLASNTLQELDLSVNELSTLTEKTFSSLPHLAVLDLRGNAFKEIWSTSLFASNPFLREVYVKGNRWNCDGFGVNLLLMYKFLTDLSVTDKESLICFSPSNVTQLSWQEAYFHTWHSDESVAESYTMMAVLVGIIIGVLITSFVCRGIMAINKPDPPRQTSETRGLNSSGSITPQPRADAVVMRVPLREDLPPSYDEALLMPRLNASFHSLPDFADEPSEPDRNYRRSRSIGDITEFRPRNGDRRSVRRTVEIHIT